MNYNMAERNGRFYHTWSLKGERGAVHITANLTSFGEYRMEWMGGCEMHSPVPLYGSVTPNHEYCWLLDGPCWHDGSSTMFDESVAPYLPYPDDKDPHNMQQGNHDSVERVLKQMYYMWFEKNSEDD